MSDNPFDQFDAASNPFDQFDARQVTYTPPANASPVDDNSFLRNALIGSGKMFTDLGLGARQLYAGAADAIDPLPQTMSAPVTGQRPTRTSALEQEAAEKQRIDAPLMATTGAKVGQIGTGVLTAIPAAFVPGANTLVGAGVVGATMGALNPVTADQSRLLNTGLGGGLGMAGQYGAGLLGKYLASRGAAPALTGAQAAAADAGTDLGMRLTPGQQLGSTALQQFEAKLQSSPWTSGPFNVLARNNQNVLNRTGAAAIGEGGTSLDSTVLGAAYNRAGEVFGAARNPNSIVMADPAGTANVLNGIDSEYEGLLPGGASIRSNKLVANFENMTGSGAINGEQLGQLSSKLGKAAYKEMTSPSGDRDLGSALYAVKDHADDLLQSSLSSEDAAAYSQARSEYRSLMQLTKSPNIVNPSTGDISGANLANSLQRTDRPGYLFGGNQSDLYNSARFAQAFKPIVGNSGTATRSETKLWQLPLSIPANMFSRAYLTGLGQAAARGIVQAPRAIGDATQLALPYMQPGLPGLSGGTVPYLTQ